MSTHDDFDPDRFGEKGRYGVGLPDHSAEDDGQPSIATTASMVREVFGFAFPTKQEQARRWVREAMEELAR